MRHLPNIICLCRIALIWPIVDSLLGGSYERTLLLFVVAALSDGLDGWLAKRYGGPAAWENGWIHSPTNLLLVSVFWC
jgi:cardiolipin synthase